MLPPPKLLGGGGPGPPLSTPMTLLFLGPCLGVKIFRICQRLYGLYEFRHDFSTLTDFLGPDPEVIKKFHAQLS